MSMSMGFGVYNTYKQLLRSFDSYLEAVNYIKSLKNKNYEKVHYLFEEKPRQIYITKALYIQRYFESGGGVERYGTKYYYRKDKF